MAIPDGIDTVQGDMKERFEIVVGPAGRNRVDNLVQIQIDEKGGRVDLLRRDAFIGPCKEYAH
jgi:hypothetical protein